MTAAPTIRRRPGRLTVAAAGLALSALGVAGCAATPAGEREPDRAATQVATEEAPEATGCGSSAVPSPTPGSGGGVISQPCASTSEPANDALPQDFVGTWRSVGNVEQTPPAGEYTLTLTLRPGPVGTVVGEIDYPELGCSGELTLEAVGPGSVTVTELITADPQLTCVAEGSIELSPNGSGLDYAYTSQFESSVTSTAELTPA